MASQIQDIIRLKNELQRDDANQYDILQQLALINVTKDALKDTQIGKVVGKLRETGSSDQVRALAKQVVDSWKKAIEAPRQKSESTVTNNSSDMADLEQDLTTIMSVATSGDHRRDRVRELLFASLRPKTDDEEREPALVSEIIETSCFKALKEKEYNTQIRSIKFNLSDPKNPDFRRKVLTGFFPENKFPTLKAEDMASSEWNEKREQVRRSALEECQSDWAMRHGGIQASGMFQCGKCKGSKTTYFQMQTRSADEPMTTFVTCLICKNKWKFC